MEAIQTDGRERANGEEKLILSCPHWVLEIEILFGTWALFLSSYIIIRVIIIHLQHNHGEWWQHQKKGAVKVSSLIVHLVIVHRR